MIVAHCVDIYSSYLLDFGQLNRMGLHSEMHQKSLPSIRQNVLMHNIADGHNSYMDFIGTSFYPSLSKG